ncbi:hypothetical protein [Paenibacillus sp. NPDC058071]|uniref:hypothetical protein n=1 Tax=Paenibacillus sp. NPDC058071 TaxID=3346326 RepID=UPI0036DCF95A
MRKAMLVCLLMVVIIMGCTNREHSNEEAVIITAEQLKQAFAAFDITLTEPQGLSPDNVFIRTLNGVKPEVYAIDNDTFISFYVFPSSQDAAKGRIEFEDIPASFVTHSKYQVANILLFYVGDNAAVRERMQELADGLLVAK